MPAESKKRKNSNSHIEEKPVTVEKGAIYISEFMAQNSSTLAHEDGGFYDWIELTNSSNDSVDLSGYFLTDNRKKLTKSRLDSLTIAPHKTLLLWANGKPKNKKEVDFKLAKEQGEILLVSPDSVTVRSHVSYGWQAYDYSQCYVEETWFYTDLPTPDEINSSKNLRVGKKGWENNGFLISAVRW
jgi:hypothetical protein